MRIAALLGIKRGVTAIIGGGGKTTLMYKLAAELEEKGSVIICTSTHIRIPDRFPLVTDGEAGIKKVLGPHCTVCAGTPSGDGKLAAPDISFEKLSSMADYVLVEADGSKGLPLKAHAAHEPVIPVVAEKTILVVGADGLGKKIGEVCHRAEIWAELSGLPEDGPATPAGEAEVIRKEGFGSCVFINKAETPEEKLLSEELARYLDLPVITGSLKKEEYREWR